MHIAVLGATGATGVEIVRQAHHRGHRVTALVRDQSKAAWPEANSGVEIREFDVLSGSALDLRGVDVAVSALGIRKGDPAGTLRAGAEALMSSAAGHVVWLGALGAGASRGSAGWFYGALQSLIVGREHADKDGADLLALKANASVVHPGPLSDGEVSPTRRTVSVTELETRLVPAKVSRATVAAAMLDEAESPRFRGTVGVPLS